MLKKRLKQGIEDFGRFWTSMFGVERVDFQTCQLSRMSSQDDLDWTRLRRIWESKFRVRFNQNIQTLSNQPNQNRCCLFLMDFFLQISIFLGVWKIGKSPMDRGGWLMSGSWRGLREDFPHILLAPWRCSFFFVMHVNIPWIQSFLGRDYCFVTIGRAKPHLVGDW